MSSVKEKSVVIREAQAAGTQAHFGRIAEPCHTKGSEFGPDSELCVYKGRRCFPGDQAKDENHDWVALNEMGPTPPSLDAKTAMDATSCMPRYDLYPADATSAYTQAYLEDTVT